MQKRTIKVFALSTFLLLFAILASLFASSVLRSFAAPANGINPYSPAYGHSYRHGAVPTLSQLGQMKAYQSAHPAATGPNTLTYGGGIDGIGVTSGTPKIYLVFWGTQWGTQSTNSQGDLTFSSDSAGAAPYVQNLFKGLGTGNELWSGTMTQYCDGPGVSAGASSCSTSAAHVGYPTGGALAGVWYDNSSTEPNAASGHQLAQEAVNAASHFGNTTAATNRFAQYDILSAKGTNPDNYKTQGFCAWHDYNGDNTLDGGGGVTSPSGDIAFTNMPYVVDAGTSCGQNFVNSAGTLDGVSIVNGHEYAETVTDQNPAGGWTNPTSGEENGDQCAWISSGQGASANVTMGNGSYAMQSTWSNDTNRCDISHPTVGGGGGSNDFSISANPTSLSIAQGSSGTSTISTAVTSGSAGTVSLSASVSPSGPTASLSSSSVTAGNSSTLTVNVGSSVATGSYTVTVTGTEGSASHSTSVTVNVTAPGSNDFSISANPTSLSIAQGSSGTSTISTAVTSGSAGTVSLSASVSPSGPTASLSSSSVTAGNSSTLTVNVGSSVATGSYTVTITGTEGSASHSTSVTVNVTSAGGGGGGNLIVNSGFENGTSPWKESSLGGYEIIDPANPHTGTYSAYLCGVSQCNDQIWQTLTLPSSFTTATFSYWTYIDTSETSTTTCYDNFHAELRTSSGSPIATVQTQCNLNAHGWTKYTFTVTSQLSAYEGQAIQVYFQGTTDSILPTDFFVDDVSLVFS